MFLLCGAGRRATSILKGRGYTLAATLKYKTLPTLVAIVMAVQTERPTHDGNDVEIIDSESHRSEEMREIRYLEGENEGATTWVFADELEGI